MVTMRSTLLVPSGEPKPIKSSILGENCRSSQKADGRKELADLKAGRNCQRRPERRDSSILWAGKEGGGGGSGGAAPRPPEAAARGAEGEGPGAGPGDDGLRFLVQDED